MTETAVARIRRLAEQLPGIGLAAMMMHNPAYREGIHEQQCEARHFEEARALGVSIDDARMILDRERVPAIERARTTPYPLDRDAMWQRVHDQLLRHLMGEPYDPHPRFTEFLRQIGAMEREPLQPAAPLGESAGMSILDRIDDTLDDWHGSGDSMRWTPEDAPKPSRFTRSLVSISVAPPGTNPRDTEAFTVLDPNWYGQVAIEGDPDRTAGVVFRGNEFVVTFTADTSGFTGAMSHLQRAIDQMSAAPRASALDARYHRRYRNRQGRR